MCDFQPNHIATGSLQIKECTLVTGTMRPWVEQMEEVNCLNATYLIANCYYSTFLKISTALYGTGTTEYVLYNRTGSR